MLGLIVNMWYYLIQVTQWPDMGHFRNRLNLKAHSPDLEIFMNGNQIFQRKKKDHLNTKLFSGNKEKKNQLQSQSLIYRIYVDTERLLNVSIHCGVTFAVLNLRLLKSTHLF